MSDQQKEETILGLADLKKLIIGCFSIAILVGGYYIREQDKRISVNESKIQVVEKAQEVMNQWRVSTEKSLNESLVNQKEILDQMTDLRLNAATTGETIRSMRDKLEALLTFLRSQSPKLPDPVFSPQQGSKAIDHSLHTADNVAVSNLNGYKPKP